MERKMVRCTTMAFDGNEIWQLAMRFVIDNNDDDVDDGNDDAVTFNGNNVRMQCKLDKCVNAQRAMRWMYERNG